jgi:hypothetical protein
MEDLMNDTVDAETILKEAILKVIIHNLEKHSIPVKTVALDISLLTQDFEMIFPQLKDYKAGVFYRHFVIEGIPTTLHAKRRIPFDEIVKWLELNILPFVKELTTEVEQEFENIKTHFQVSHRDDSTKSVGRYNYSINIDCRRRDEPQVREGNTITMSVGVSQYDAASYPILYGFVGWLVDEESGGDFGLDTVFNLNPLNLEVHEGALNQLKKLLPTIRQYLLKEIPKLYSQGDWQ